AAMPKVRFTRRSSQQSIAGSRAERESPSTTIALQDCAVADGKKAVLLELHLLTQERQSRHETLLGRFLECQELQMSSALLARAVEQCSRWHAGKRLAPPGGSLPPAS